MRGHIWYDWGARVLQTAAVATGAVGVWQFGARAFIRLWTEPMTITVAGPCHDVAWPGESRCAASWTSGNRAASWEGWVIGADAGDVGRPVSVFILGDNAYLPDGGRALLGWLAAIVLIAGATAALYPTLTRLGPHVGTGPHSQLGPYGSTGGQSGHSRDYWSDAGGGCGSGCGAGSGCGGGGGGGG